MKCFLALIFLIAFYSEAFSQTSPITFGAVTRSDLETEPTSLEKGAEATVLCDYTAARLIYNDGLKIEIVRHIRIKIFKSAGYGFGNIMIRYAKEDKLSELKASTYNLVNNKIEVVPIGKKQIYEETTNKYENTTRFAFPQVREGSVIEYTYKLTQVEIRRFVSFKFQKSIPVRLVECWAVFPEFFRYTINYTGNDNINQKHTKQKDFYNTFSTFYDIYQWTGKQLPALQEEPYMPENDEYYPGVSFALSLVDFPGGDYFEVSPTYKKLTTDLLNYSDFGSQLNNQFIFGKEVKEIIVGMTTKTEQMQALYDHVKANIKWNGVKRRVPDKSIRITYRDKTGNNADINTILINMLRTAGISADPVVLSTRENGSLNPFLALAGDLNYLVCLAEIDGKEYLLDATDRLRPLGMLPYNCLNGEGWVLNEAHGRWVKLLNDEKKSTTEFYDLDIDENGIIKGSAAITFKGYDAVVMRNLINNKSIEGFREEKISIAGNLKVYDLIVKNLDNINEPLVVNFSIEVNHLIQSGNALSFFRPVYSLFGSLVSPWIKEERVYPIDYGCPVFSKITCVYHLPETFTIGEIPKSLKLILPGNDAGFTYRISSGDRILTVDGELTITKLWFKPDEYSAVREFYTQIIKKTNEMVVIQ
jgi:transglutaminase-like putative cysteine protease